MTQARRVPEINNLNIDLEANPLTHELRCPPHLIKPRKCATAPTPEEILAQKEKKRLQDVQNRQRKALARANKNASSARGS